MVNGETKVEGLNMFLCITNHSVMAYMQVSEIWVGMIKQFRVIDWGESNHLPLSPELCIYMSQK